MIMGQCKPSRKTLRWRNVNVLGCDSVGRRWERLPVIRVSPSARTPLVRRLYPATWAVIFFAMAILALNRDSWPPLGATTYVHGWPVAYLHRDYIGDPDFIAAMSSTGWTPGSTVMPASPGGTPKTAMDFWTEDGWPWEVERTLNPWSTANTTEISLTGAGLDCVAVLLIVLAVAEILQRWRRAAREAYFAFGCERC